jgi:hypothetical protein
MCDKEEGREEVKLESLEYPPSILEIKQLTFLSLQSAYNLCARSSWFLEYLGRGERTIFKSERMYF